jgi:excisionase family DNA binding protein
VSGLLLTYAQVGDELGVSADTVKNLVRRGDLYAVTIGEKLRRVTRAELERFVVNLDRRAHGLEPIRPPADVEAARLRLVEERPA